MSWSTELEPLAQDLGHACLVQNKKLNCAKAYTQSVARIRRLALAFRLADVDIKDMEEITSLLPLPEGPSPQSLQCYVKHVQSAQL